MCSIRWSKWIKNQVVNLGLCFSFVLCRSSVELRWSKSWGSVEYISFQYVFPQSSCVSVVYCRAQESLQCWRALLERISCLVDLVIKGNIWFWLYLFTAIFILKSWENDKCTYICRDCHSAPSCLAAS